MPTCKHKMDKIAEIGSACYESYPCKHTVIFESGRSQLMSGPKIMEYFSNSCSTITKNSTYNLLKHLYQSNYPVDPRCINYIKNQIDKKTEELSKNPLTQITNGRDIHSFFTSEEPHITLCKKQLMRCTECNYEYLNIPAGTMPVKLTAGFLNALYFTSTEPVSINFDDKLFNTYYPGVFGLCEIVSPIPLSKIKTITTDSPVTMRIIIDNYTHHRGANGSNNLVVPMYKHIFSGSSSDFMCNLAEPVYCQSIHITSSVIDIIQYVTVKNTNALINKIPASLFRKNGQLCIELVPTDDNLTTGEVVTSDMQITLEPPVECSIYLKCMKLVDCLPT